MIEWLRSIEFLTARSSFLILPTESPTRRAPRLLVAVFCFAPHGQLEGDRVRCTPPESAMLAISVLHLPNRPAMVSPSRSR